MMSIPYQAFAGNQQAQWASQAAQERNNYLANYYAQQTPIQPPTPLTEEEKEEIERKREEERREEERESERRMKREREIEICRERREARIAASQAEARAEHKNYWGNPRNRYIQMVSDNMNNSLYSISKILRYIIWPVGSIIIFVKIKNIIDNENETKQLKWKKEWSNCTEWIDHYHCSENNCDWVCDEKTCTWDAPPPFPPSICDFDSPTWETNCWGKCIAPLYDDDTSWFGWVLLIVLGYIIVLYMLYAIIYKVCMKRYEYAVKKSKNLLFNISQDEEQQALIYKDGKDDVPAPWWVLGGFGCDTPEHRAWRVSEDGYLYYLRSWIKAPEPLECGPTCWKWQWSECPECCCATLRCCCYCYWCSPRGATEEAECCMCIIPTLIFAGVIGLIILVMYTTSHPMG